MTWNPIAEPVDFVILAGQRTPGIAEVQGFRSPRNWDERRGYGLSGATLRFRGVGLASGKLIIRLTTEQDWADWEAFAPVVKRPPVGERAHALDISHPILEQLDIRAVVVTDVAQPEQDDKGVWTITIELKEYRRPVIQLSTPDGAATTPEPQTEGQRMIAALTAQVQELASQ